MVAYVQSQLNNMKIYFAGFASLYCSRLGLSLKEICVSFGRYLWWSSMFLCSSGWYRTPGTMAIHTVAAALKVQFIVDLKPLDLPPDILLMFSLYETKYACSMMANDIHFSWSSPTTVSPKEVRERQVLVGSVVLIYFHTCHSLSMLLSTSNFPLQTLLWLTYSEFNSTPNTNTTVFMDSPTSSRHCLCSNPYN